MSLDGVQILGPVSNDASKFPWKDSTTPSQILTKGAVEFLATLHRSFQFGRTACLENRKTYLQDIVAGRLELGPLASTESVRNDPSWSGPAIGPGLEDRRVEITGPPDRKMIVNALNADVKTYMSDFEDSMAPTWDNVLWGQAHLYDAVRDQLAFTDPKTGKEYKVVKKDDGKKPVVLLVRPRGWHMSEKHMVVDGEPISASLFDFGLFFYHNGKELVKRGFGPYFYLPKMESHLEARLWNSVFTKAQELLGIPVGTIRATVLIETLPGAFQMEEIIYELRNHSAGLNCGRWDYIFSFVKTLRQSPNHILPDRADVTMTVPFMSAYVKKLIDVCHRRKVHAMGGMAAQIPIKDDDQRNKAAMDKVRADKLREVNAGHDGTWVAHPALAAIANQVFDEHMPQPNQLSRIPSSEPGYVAVQTSDLLNSQFPGKITEHGIRINIYIALCYMEAWLRGLGCVPIDYLMEDAATAEVSRSQLNQWVTHKCKTDDGTEITAEFNSRLLDEELAKLLKDAKPGNKFARAAEWLRPEVTGDHFADFLTTLIYDDIVHPLPNSIDLSSLLD